MCSLTGAISLQIYSVSGSQLMWILRLHHTVIYIFYGILGVTKILGATINSFPASLTKLALSNAFFGQGKYQYFSLVFSQLLDINVAFYRVRLVSWHSLDWWDHFYLGHCEIFGCQNVKDFPSLLTYLVHLGQQNHPMYFIYVSPFTLKTHLLTQDISYHLLAL